MLTFDVADTVILVIERWMMETFLNIVLFLSMDCSAAYPFAGCFSFLR